MVRPIEPDPPNRHEAISAVLRRSYRGSSMLTPQSVRSQRPGLPRFELVWDYDTGSILVASIADDEVVWHYHR